VKFSLRTNNDLTVDEFAEICVSAEQAGFDQLWISNDLMLRSAPVIIGYLAGLTSRIQLGTSIMNPYTVHPTELAMMAATAQEISKGRFLLGVGAGAEEFLGWAGIERVKPLTTTLHAVASIRSMLGHRDVQEADLPEWWNENAALRFATDIPVPVYVGAMGPKMTQMTGRVADGALPLLYPPEHFTEARENILIGLEQAGRDESDFDLPACIWVSVSEDPRAGRRELAKKLAYFGPSISPILLAKVGLTPEHFKPAAALAMAGDLEAAADLIDDRMLALGIAGSPDEVIKRCRSLVDLGAQHLSFGPPLGRTAVEGVRLLGSEVLPALR
jgi:5,10-methylenetetrahydromethanopterin reductase